MLTKNALISTLIALTTLACASARPAVNKGDDNSTSVFIPPPPGWTFEDFEALKEALTRLEVSSFNFLLCILNAPNW